MTYDLIFSDEAERDIKALKRNEPQAYKKLLKLLEELIEYPKTGTGKPEILRRDGVYSRRITLKHRLVYLIDEEQFNVLIISALGHYNDK